MLTLDKLLTMPPDARTAAFVRLATLAYGNGYKTALAADFGAVRQSVGRWVREDAVPVAWILALEAMRMHKAASQLGGLIRELTA